MAKFYQEYYEDTNYFSYIFNLSKEKDKIILKKEIDSCNQKF